MLAGDASVDGKPDRRSLKRRLVVVLDGLAARFGGTAYAVVQLAAALERRDDVDRVIVIAQRDSVVGRSIKASSAVTPRLLDAPTSRAELIWRGAWETVRLPQLAIDARADLVVTFSGMLPRRPGCPVICLLANPVPYADAGSIGSRLRRAAITRTRRYAIASYVPSQAMVEMVGDPPAKLVPLGVDRQAFRPQAVPGEGLLYVADFYAHKRHDLMLRAWQMLPEPKPRLRFVGNPEVDERTFAKVRDAATDPRVSVDGMVTFGELLEAYRGARAVVLPSERESFSMPLAEAVASGIPAVIRDDPVLRETAGPAGLVVEESTPEAWCEALARIVRDDKLHERLSKAGLDHGHRFSWDTMAAEMVADVVLAA